MSDYDLRRKNELLQKLQNRTINAYEQNELRTILEREKASANNSGDWAKALGALLILAGLAYLIDSDSKNSKKRRRK